MSTMSKYHQELDENGEGKCSVPMWMGGAPAGFCDEPAYGTRPLCKEWRNACTNELMREDGRYNGYVPALACQGHGGPAKPTVTYKTLVDRAVAVLQAHIVPDGLSDHDALTKLYGVFDGPDYREATEKSQ